MASNNETVADIVAEMRLGVKDWKGERLGVFDCFADRIEAAAKQSVTNCNRLSNAAAMREALESVRNWCLNRLGEPSEQVTTEGLLLIVNAALSLPPRNCDVGTADDQVKRYFAFCGRHTCQSCPVKGTTDCGFLWEQMQYEKGETK